MLREAWVCKIALAWAICSCYWGNWGREMSVPLQICLHVHRFVLTLSEVKTLIWNHCVLVLSFSLIFLVVWLINLECLQVLEPCKALQTQWTGFYEVRLLLGGLIISTAMPSLREERGCLPLRTRRGTVLKSLQSLELLGPAVFSW